MTRDKRRSGLLLLAAAVLVAFLAGTVTAGGDTTVRAPAAAPHSLTPAQWAAVQASNALLSGGASHFVHLPLAARGQ